MRRVSLSRDDYDLFHQDITPLEFEFFVTHAGAFKRMWNEQGRLFWSMFVSTFDHFIWNYGTMKDFPMTENESRRYVNDIIGYIRTVFVEGRIATAKGLVMDCAVVAQHKNCIVLLDRANYTQSPFVMKETREVFRQLFGPQTDRKTFMKVLCGLPVYVKFGGSVVCFLHRWLQAEIIPDKRLESEYLSSINKRPGAEAGRREDLMRVVGRLKPPISTVAKVKPSSPKSVKSKPSGSGDCGDVGGHVKGEVVEREGAGKKKRKKKKKKAAEEKTEIVDEKNDKKKDEGALIGVCETTERKKVEADSLCSSPNSTADSGIGSGAEHVATDTPAGQTTDSGGGVCEKSDASRRRRLHTCACCGAAERVAKTFKRCQKCRGLPIPNYYCSRDCQAKHWKEHKWDHREEGEGGSLVTGDDSEGGSLVTREEGEGGRSVAGEEDN